MTPEIHRRASELFNEFRDLPENEREAALDASCAGDDELRARVVRLLEADREAASGSFLGRPAIEDAARLLAAESPDLPSSGTVLGNYRLRERIGAGGMGVVYEADDLHLDRRVAVKVLSLTLAEEAADRIQRFKREARATSLLNHPNIVSIFDADFDQGCYYIVMEFVEGNTLRTLIAAESRLIDVRTILDVIGQTAAALSAAHEAGIVHRDIKPENIMVRPDGFVKVLDFGLAKLRERTANRENGLPELRTRAGHVAGTIQYLSPEQVLGKPVGPRSDLFSLGVVAYELATGARPFEGPTDGAIFDAIVNRQPAPPSSIRPALGRELDGMILQALEKDPELRFQTASDLRSSCKRLSRDSLHPGAVPMAQRGEFAPVADAGKGPRIAKRRWIGAAASGLALVVPIAAGAWLYASFRNRNQKTAPNSLQITTLAALPGSQLHPSLSPDGRKLALVWNGNGNNYDIYVKSIDQETPRRLTSNEAQDLNPTWSPDGSQIAFLRANPAKEEIIVLPSEGGPERKVAEIHPVAIPLEQEASVMRRTPGPAWSPDGQWLAVTDRCDSQAISDCVYLLSLDGSRRQRITSGAALGDYAPAFSPDGKRIAFLRTVADVGVSDIYTQPVKGGSELRLTSDDKMISSLAWSTDHRIYFVSNRTANSLLWSIPESGGAAELVPGVGDAFGVSAASRTNQLAFARHYRNSNIWRTSLAAPGGQTALLIGSSRSNYSAQYSPDGSQIVFISDRAGGPEIWLANADGSNSHRVTFSSTIRPIGSPTLSPDGKQCVYDSVTAGLSQVFLMNVDGTNQRQFTSDAWEAMMPTWSTDGRSIYYMARRKGVMSLWKRPVDGGSAVHMADDVRSDALEDSEGRRVFFSKSTPGIWEASSSGGDARLIPELAGVVDSRHCFVDRKGIYFLAHDLPPWEIHFFEFATRRVSSVATLSHTLEFFTRSLSISPDGKWMLHAQVDQMGSEIALVSNVQ